MEDRQVSIDSVSVLQTRRAARAALRKIERAMQDPRAQRDLLEPPEEGKCFCPRLIWNQKPIAKWYVRENIRDRDKFCRKCSACDK